MNGENLLKKTVNPIQFNNKTKQKITTVTFKMKNNLYKKRTRE